VFLKVFTTFAHSPAICCYDAVVRSIGVFLALSCIFACSGSLDVTSPNPTADGTQQTGRSAIAFAPDNTGTAPPSVNQCKPVDPSPDKLPAAFVPARRSSDCTPQLVSQYQSQCFTTSNSSGRTECAFRLQYPLCAACLETLTLEDTQPHDVAMPTTHDWGPYIPWAGGYHELNRAGCVELHGDIECAKAIEEARWCERTACEKAPLSCIAGYAEDGTAYALGRAPSCMVAAAGGLPHTSISPLTQHSICTKYHNQVEARCAQSTAYAACAYDVAHFAQNYFEYANLFCSRPGP